MDKQRLYQTIQNNPVVTRALVEWFMKVCSFCDKFEAVDFNVFFPGGAPTQCGYVEASTLRANINARNTYNQRVLLTTIYRFSKVFAEMLWKAIAILRNDASIDKLIVGILSRDELIRHAKFVLQKHGIRVDNQKDPILLLWETFLIRDVEGFFSRNAKKYPSMITSLTQTIGNDPVSTWTNTGVRMSYPVPIGEKTVNRELLRNFGSELCFLEISVLRDQDPLPWITGARLFYVNPESEFFNLAAKNNKYMRCGPSCTTQMMLDCAMLFGIDARIALLAIVPWMEIAKDHSLFEILIAANPYIPTLDYNLVPNSDPDGYELQKLAALCNEIGIQLGGGSKIDRQKSRKQKGGTMDDYQNTVTGGEVYYPQCTQIAEGTASACLIADVWQPSIHEQITGFNGNVATRPLTHQGQSPYYLTQQDIKREKITERIQSSQQSGPWPNVRQVGIVGGPNGSHWDGGNKKERIKGKNHKN